MKKTIVFLISILFCTTIALAQEKSLPNIDVKTLKGKTINIQNL